MYVVDVQLGFELKNHTAKFVDILNVLHLIAHTHPYFLNCLNIIPQLQWGIL